MYNMKKIIYTALIAICGLSGLSSCSKENSTVPVSLDQNSLSYVARPGAVKLMWNIPDKADYKYIKITYSLPGDTQERMKLASVYTDTLLVNNLLQKYGDITFKLQTVSSDGGLGNICSISAKALPATKTTTVEKLDVSLTPDKDHVWSDDPESSEGPIANLVDGNTGNYFHMSWSDSKPFPHYIVMDLGTTVNGLQFNYTCRNNNNKDNPKDMDILVSDSFENTPAYYTAETGTTKIASFTSLPSDKAASYTSSGIISSKPFRYVWFKILSATSGSDWVALAEMSVYKVRVTTYDPETGETTIAE